MLDLKELEKRLDEALEKETTYSLTSWILNQRKDDLESFFGVGYIQKFKVSPYFFNVDLLVKAQYTTCGNKNNPSEELAMAA